MNVISKQKTGYPFFVFLLTRFFCFFLLDQENKKRIIRFLFFCQSLFLFFFYLFKKTKNGLSVFCFLLIVLFLPISRKQKTGYPFFVFSSTKFFCLISACSRKQKTGYPFFVFLMIGLLTLFLFVPENKKRITRFLFFWRLVFFTITKTKNG